MAPSGAKYEIDGYHLWHDGTFIESSETAELKEWERAQIPNMPSRFFIQANIPRGDGSVLTAYGFLEMDGDFFGAGFFQCPMDLDGSPLSYPALEWISKINMQAIEGKLTEQFPRDLFGMTEIKEYKTIPIHFNMFTNIRGVASAFGLTRHVPKLEQLDGRRSMNFIRTPEHKKKGKFVSSAHGLATVIGTDTGITVNPLPVTLLESDVFPQGI